MRRTALFLALLSGAAHAETFGQTDAPAKPSEDFRSPQNFAFELKFGMYSPDIDSTPGLTGHPFSDLFVDQYSKDVGQRPPGKLLTTLEFDWQFWHRFGSLALAVSGGIMRRSTHSFQYDASPTGDPTQIGPSCQVPHCTRSADETTLTVMPFALMLVYRFDVLAIRYRIPFVPYVKFGLAYYLWWIENGNGDLATALSPAPDGSTDKAIGGTFGLVVLPGIAFLLDVLDPSAARVLDSELGINHSYIFFEMNYGWISGFDIGNKMVLSDLTWNAGAAFEF